MIYFALHSAVTHTGHSWLWVISDCVGVVLGHGRAPRREVAREEMRKTMKKLRKQPEKAVRHREPMFETWHRNNPE